MPNYVFQCEECLHALEETLTMEERDALVGLPCPECGTGELIRPFILNAPRSEPVMDSKVRIDGKQPQGFRDNIARICDSPTIKGTKYADRLKSKFI